MNTYRVSVVKSDGTCAVSIQYYDVDALTPAIAIRRSMKHTDFGHDLTGVSCRLFAKDIFPFNKLAVREVAA